MKTEDKRNIVTFSLQSVNHSTIHRIRIGKKKKDQTEAKVPRILGLRTKPSFFVKRNQRFNCVETVWLRRSASMAMLWDKNTEGKLAIFKLVVEKKECICYLYDRRLRTAFLQKT